MNWNAQLHIQCLNGINPSWLYIALRIWTIVHTRTKLLQPTVLRVLLSQRVAHAVFSQPLLKY
ncbi:Uncharacterised protein [Vibrio cholerae]|nr:Uncharacterised protein [Vibrio cholerae]